MGAWTVGVVGSDRIRGACVCIKSEMKKADQKKERGGAKPSARPSDLHQENTTVLGAP